MKKLLFISTVVSLFFIFSCKNKENNKTESSDSTKVETVFSQNKNLKLLVYYFYSTHRCPTCLSIEENVKAVLDNNFKSDIESGIIKFEALNIDEKSNSEIVEKYKIYGSSLILITQENKNEKVNDLTDYSFTYSRNQPDFYKKHIQDTITYFIK